MPSLSPDSLKEFFQKLPLGAAQFLSFRAQRTGDAPLPADVGVGCAAEPQEGFYHLAYHMKPVGNYLCFREEALDDAAEGLRAQILPHVQICYNAYHMAGNMDKTLDRIRRSVMKNPSHRLKKLMKGNCFILLREGKIGQNSKAAFKGIMRSQPEPCVASLFA